MPAAADLKKQLEALPVTVTAMSYTRGFAAVTRDYPPPGRPCGLLSYDGCGEQGQGENIAFTASQQALDEKYLEASFRPFSGRVQDWPAFLPPALQYASECALVDLALRQNRLNLADLFPECASTLNYVVSFAASQQPMTVMRQCLSSFPDAHFKIDLHSSWEKNILADLAASERCTILDFKEQKPALCEQTFRHFLPEVVFEDAPAPWQGPKALDRCILEPQDIAAALAEATSINIKGPRLGGLFRTLDAVQRCQDQGRSFYWGGMSEVLCGRSQARKLAALFCPNAGNDLAPVLTPENEKERFPQRLPVDLGGMGF